MNEMIILGVILAFVGNSPNTGAPQFEVVSYSEMNLEDCAKQAYNINNDHTIPYIMVCQPKIVTESAQ